MAEISGGPPTVTGTSGPKPPTPASWIQALQDHPAAERSSSILMEASLEMSNHPFFRQLPLAALPQLCAAMTIVRLDRNRELSLAHKAPLYVILEGRLRVVDADVRPLKTGDTLGLTYPGNFWNFRAVSQCFLCRLPRAAITSIIGEGKFDDYAWLPELTKDILADGRSSSRTIKEKELIIEQLRNVKLFRGLSQELSSTLTDHMQSCKRPIDTIIKHVGDLSFNTIIIVLRGKISVALQPPSSSPIDGDAIPADWPAELCFTDGQHFIPSDHRVTLGQSPYVIRVDSREAEYLTLPGDVYSATMHPTADMGFSMDACHRYFLEHQQSLGGRGGSGGGAKEEARKADTEHVVRHLLRPSPFFQQLPWGICEALVASMEMEYLAQDELLVFRDETGLDECYVLLRGVMQYSDAMVRFGGQRGAVSGLPPRVHGLIHPGDVVGTQNCYQARPCPVTIRAVTACDVLVLKSRKLLRVEQRRRIKADFWDRGPVKPTSGASQANPTQTSRQPASPMAAHTFALAGTQRPDTSGQLMGTAALLSATQQASKVLSPKAFKPLAARLSAAASLDGIPLSRLLRQQVDAETDAALTDAADVQAAYRDRVCELFTMPDSPLYCSGLRSVPVSLKLRLVDAMCIKQLPARATLGFLHNLYAIVLSGSVSTHRLCGATKTVPRTKLASRSDLETVEVRQAWALLRLGPCVEVYSEGDLLGGARTSVGQTPFKVMTRQPTQLLSVDLPRLRSSLQSGHALCHRLNALVEQARARVAVAAGAMHKTDRPAAEAHGEGQHAHHPEERPFELRSGSEELLLLVMTLLRDLCIPSVKELRAPQLLALCRAFTIVHLPPGPRTLAELHEEEKPFCIVLEGTVDVLVEVPAPALRDAEQLGPSDSPTAKPTTTAAADKAKATTVMNDTVRSLGGAVRNFGVATTARPSVAARSTNVGALGPGECFGEEAFDTPDFYSRSAWSNLPRYGIQCSKGVRLLTIDRAKCRAILAAFEEEATTIGTGEMMVESTGPLPLDVTTPCLAATGDVLALSQPFMLSQRLAVSQQPFKPFQPFALSQEPFALSQPLAISQQPFMLSQPLALSQQPFAETQQPSTPSQPPAAVAFELPPTPRMGEEERKAEPHPPLTTQASFHGRARPPRLRRSEVRKLLPKKGGAAGTQEKAGGGQGLIEDMRLWLLHTYGVGRPPVSPPSGGPAFTPVGPAALKPVPLKARHRVPRGVDPRLFHQAVVEQRARHGRARQAVTLALQALRRRERAAALAAAHAPTPTTFSYTYTPSTWVDSSRAPTQDRSPSLPPTHGSTPTVDSRTPCRNIETPRDIDFSGCLLLAPTPPSRPSTLDSRTYYRRSRLTTTSTATSATPR